MKGQQTYSANAQQSYNYSRVVYFILEFVNASHLASRTSQRTDQSLPKSMPAPSQEKIQNIFSFPSKKIKTPATQTNPTKESKLNKVNGLQGRTTRSTGHNKQFGNMAGVVLLLSRSTRFNGSNSIELLC